MHNDFAYLYCMCFPVCFLLVVAKKETQKCICSMTEHGTVLPHSLSYSHLICTLISENQGLEKLTSILNLRKISGPAQLNFFSAHLNFFSVCHLNFFQIYTINLKKSRRQTEKKLRCIEKKFRSAGPEFFLRSEADLNFSRP